MSNGPIIPHDLAARRIEDALRLRVGRGRRFSFTALSDATGIPTRTLESYVQGATPGLAALLSLCTVLGPSFTSDILSACGQVASDADPDAPEHVRVIGMMGSMVSAVSDALADGHVDHREAAQMRPMAAELIEALQPLAANQGGGHPMTPEPNTEGQRYTCPPSVSDPLAGNYPGAAASGAFLPLSGKGYGLFLSAAALAVSFLPRVSCRGRCAQPSAQSLRRAHLAALWPDILVNHQDINSSAQGTWGLGGCAEGVA